MCIRTICNGLSHGRTPRSQQRCTGFQCSISLRGRIGLEYHEFDFAARGTLCSACYDARRLNLEQESEVAAQRDADARANRPARPEPSEPSREAWNDRVRDVRQRAFTARRPFANPDVDPAGEGRRAPAPERPSGRQTAAFNPSPYQHASQRQQGDTRNFADPRPQHPSRRANAATHWAFNSFAPLLSQHRQYAAWDSVLDQPPNSQQRLPTTAPQNPTSSDFSSRMPVIGTKNSNQRGPLPMPRLPAGPLFPIGPPPRQANNFPPAPFDRRWRGTISVANQLPGRSVQNTIQPQSSDQRRWQNIRRAPYPAPYHPPAQFAIPLLRNNHHHVGAARNRSNRMTPAQGGIVGGPDTRARFLNLSSDERIAAGALLALARRPFPSGSFRQEGEQEGHREGEQEGEQEGDKEDAQEAELEGEYDRMR